MSSLAAARADNFYFPPEWRPEMGGISKFQGSKGANQYQLYGIIRFELPFDGWCTKCSTHISKGTRFNAKKDKCGKYFSTTLFAFTMKCASCDQNIIIKTDPEHRTYDYAEGIRKMETDFIPDANDSIIEATSDEKRLLLNNDPIFKLQHDYDDRTKSQKAREEVAGLIEISDNIRSNDYDVNSMLRSKHRSRKSRDQQLLAEGERAGIGVALVENNEIDNIEASSIKFKRHLKNHSYRTAEVAKITSIQNQGIFSVGNSKDGQTDTMKRNISDKSISKAALKKSQENQAMMKQAKQNIDVRNIKLTVEGVPDALQVNPVTICVKRKSHESDCIKKMTTRNSRTTVNNICIADTEREDSSSKGGGGGGRSMGGATGNTHTHTRPVAGVLAMIGNYDDADDADDADDDDGM